MSEEQNDEIAIEEDAPQDDVSEDGADEAAPDAAEMESTGDVEPAGETAPAPAPADAESKRGWQTAAIVAVSLVLLCCALWACIAAATALLGGDDEAPGQPTKAYITIDKPKRGTALDISQTVTVVGRGAGLPEGNVVVQALDERGTVLAEKPTTVQAPDAGTGGEGPWRVKLNVKAKPGTEGSIRAFSPSPLDNSVIAEDKVKVTFGGTEAVKAYIKIQEPEAGANLDVANPVRVNGMGAGLPEGNVVVRATDRDGNVLAQEATIVQVPDAGTGGEGPWAVELAIPAESGEKGLISAFSPSPLDGSIIASDELKVTYESAGPEGPEGSEVPLEGPGWLLISLDGRPVLEGTQITAEFKDEQVAGSAGCNGYFASYEVSGSALRIGPAGVTRMFCGEPPGVMEQESAYLGLLEETAGYRVARGRLECNDQNGASILAYEAAVTGQATYLQRIALPEDAVVKVQVADVSLADAPARVIGEQIITSPGQVPISYQVTYDPEVIDPRFDYAVQVRIEDGGGKLLFVNTTHNGVITRGNPSLDVEVVVEPVD